MDVQLTIPNDLWLELKQEADEKRLSVQHWIIAKLGRSSAHPGMATTNQQLSPSKEANHSDAALKLEQFRNSFKPLSIGITDQQMEQWLAERKA
jgi:hypothetical protein